MFAMKMLSEANQDCEAGDRYSLTRFLRERGEPVTRAYRELTATEMAVLRTTLAHVRKDRIRVIRTSPKAILKDINSTFDAMEGEWIAAHKHTGIEGFYFAVCGDLEHYNVPKVFCTERAEKFLKDILEIDPKRLALKLESWVVGNLVTETTGRMGRKVSTKELISKCRKLIQEGLDSILAKSKLSSRRVTMNYDNYERQIVERFGVALVQWPFDVVRNPGHSDLRPRPNLIKLLDSLGGEDPTCYWVQLTEAQLSARIAENRKRADQGEAVYKARKRQRKKDKVSAGIRSAETVHSDSDEDGEAGTNTLNTPDE
ncbi:hypothetical protein BV22DRAFT_1051637 [Leucogyrophana mollusca]|uniref:Uncharacterized protein n=1 Tax=Leucogyrophana mollusca TaxID=85980 RepID=A0ACB8B163_9AGAM|nr:hypothetical protein BV22DRAFT_1051637 [Leucogyrophana mollusca]